MSFNIEIVSTEAGLAEVKLSTVETSWLTKIVEFWCQVAVPLKILQRVMYIHRWNAFSLDQ